MDHAKEVSIRLQGVFQEENLGFLSGHFTAKAQSDRVVLFPPTGQEIFCPPSLRLVPQKEGTFSLTRVTIGKDFHWERQEDQTFAGNLVLMIRPSGTLCVINELPLEEYLRSVIASEMSASAPLEFLKAHSIISRSWFLAGIQKKHHDRIPPPAGTAEEIVRYYDRQDHDLYQVCADDHCQRYQGITKIFSGRIEEAVGATCGLVLTYGNDICDTRYSKCCGGLTEDFSTAWADRVVPYLTCVPCAPSAHPPIHTEAEAEAWIGAEAQAYCAVKDADLLGAILPGFDRETEGFFRWQVQYDQVELAGILQEKTGYDLGDISAIIPLKRGPSGRIFRLRIVGSKGSLIIGKELEIRRSLSPSHLLSSAFVVIKEGGRFILRGAGWGHGVGLCQIGAAVLAHRGARAEEILCHYFRGTEIRKLY